MDAFKRETAVGYSEFDINTKWVKSKSRHKDSKMVKRAARRKRKQKMLKELDRNSKE